MIADDDRTPRVAHQDRGGSGLQIGVFGARSLPSTYSGYETFLTALLPALVSRGHAVTMYVRDDPADASGEYRGVRRHAVRSVEGKNWSTLTHGVAATMQALRHRHDVLLVVNVANAAFCFASRVCGLPSVLNTDGQEWRRGKWGPVAQRYFWTSARLASRSATGLVTDSLAMQAFYERTFDAPSTLIPYAALELPEAAPDQVLALDLEPGKFLLTGGRLNPENNIDLIVEACLDATDLPVLVVGEANYDSPVARRLAQLADPRLRVLGHVSSRAVFGWLLANARLYLHGHSVGGINPSLLEAMGAGANILALRTPFNIEALGDGGGYFDADLRDIRAAVASELLREDDGESRARVRRRAEEVFPLDRCVDGYEDVLIAAATARRRRTKLTVPSRWAPAELRGDDDGVAGHV